MKIFERASGLNLFHSVKNLFGLNTSPKASCCPGCANPILWVTVPLTNSCCSGFNRLIIAFILVPPCFVPLKARLYTFSGVLASIKGLSVLSSNCVCLLKALFALLNACNPFSPPCATTASFMSSLKAP